jgi:hypothetical protein
MIRQCEVALDGSIEVLHRFLALLGVGADEFRLSGELGALLLSCGRESGERRL